MSNQILTQLIGKTLVKVIQHIGYDDNDELLMHFSDGSIAKFYHCQDCCESVSIDSITGGWEDLYNHPILVAEERCSNNDVSDISSQTWTFYTFRNIGGSVDVRWLGESNGYYSESVDFEFLEGGVK